MDSNLSDSTAFRTQLANIVTSEGKRVSVYNDVSDEFRHQFSIVVTIFMSGAVSIMGVCCNVINLVVFRRQGLHETVNISLFSLAVADLLCVTFTLWLSVCMVLYVLDPPSLTFDPTSLISVTASGPRIIFSRTSCWLTAVISLQRCLCVTLPFKVRRILTLKNTAACVVLVSAFTCLTHMSLYFYRTLRVGFDPRTNSTRIYTALVSYGNIDIVVNAVFFIILPVLNFLIVLTCTLIIILTLKNSQKWRSSVSYVSSKLHKTHDVISSIAESDDVKDNKEVRISRMIATIMMIFVACNAPANIILSIKYAIPEFRETGSLKNLFYATNNVVFFLEALNSSVHFFAYYSMSSRFQQAFTSVFKGNRLCRCG
ncbi:kappa-type opioid receptor-like [Physella acuta]|uniref:kappa-type opioid receptor-like n=1 Tax=Physella acuta TaxID=109671 RepID=UPI0027DC93DD|nr:kappa-type opioid receptor-like [Physella acuta]